MKHALLKGLKYAVFFLLLMFALLTGQLNQHLVSSDDIKALNFKT